MTDFALLAFALPAMRGIRFQRRLRRSRSRPLRVRGVCPKRASNSSSVRVSHRSRSKGSGSIGSRNAGAEAKGVRRLCGQQL